MRLLAKCPYCRENLVIKARTFLMGRDYEYRDYPVRLFALGENTNPNHSCLEKDKDAEVCAELNISVSYKAMTWHILRLGKFPNGIIRTEEINTYILKEFIKDFVRYVNGEQPLLANDNPPDGEETAFTPRTVTFATTTASGTTYDYNHYYNDYFTYNKDMTIINRT